MWNGIALRMKWNWMSWVNMWFGLRWGGTAVVMEILFFMIKIVKTCRYLRTIWSWWKNVLLESWKRLRSRQKNESSVSKSVWKVVFVRRLDINANLDWKRETLTWETDTFFAFVWVRELKQTRSGSWLIDSLRKKSYKYNVREKILMEDMWRNIWKLIFNVQEL